jgi:long-chain alkane monooxygenase
VPVTDPLLLIPAMAYVTRNLGFGVTCTVSYEPPYMLARRFLTLDHLTGGRIRKGHWAATTAGVRHLL